MMFGIGILLENILRQLKEINNVLYRILDLLAKMEEEKK